MRSARKYPAVIYVMRLDGSQLVVNADLIETVEHTADTVITLKDGFAAMNCRLSAQSRHQNQRRFDRERASNSDYG
jgi:hypothetical protein